MTNTESKISLQEIREFFGMGGTEFRNEWTKLTPGDKAQIKSGLADGTLTY